LLAPTSRSPRRIRSWASSIGRSRGSGLQAEPNIAQRDDLRAITISLNDERGKGGPTRFARLLGWHHSTVWRKLNGKARINQGDELEIRQAAGAPFETSCVVAGAYNHAKAL